MTIRTIIAAAALAALPAVGFAFCTHTKQQAQSCAPGTVWDVETRTCVEQVNS